MDDPQQHRQPEKLAFNVEETYRALGIGRDLAYKMCRTGQIPTIRLSRRILVPRAALEALLRGGDAEATSPSDTGPR